MANTLDAIFNNREIIEQHFDEYGIKRTGFRFDPWKPRSIHFYYVYPVHSIEAHSVRVRTNEFFLEMGLKTHKNSIPFGLANDVSNKLVSLDIVTKFKNFAEPDFEELGKDDYKGLGKNREYLLDYSNPILEGGLIILGRYSTDNPYKIVTNSLNFFWANFQAQDFQILKNILLEKRVK